MTPTEKNVETAGYEAPALVVLGPAEDLTLDLKNGMGSDSTSNFHQSV
jgi:hypothetical protein